MKTAFRILALLALVAAGGVLWMAAHLAPDVELGSASPDVTLQTAEGQPLALASLRGKVVLLDFWSST